MRSSTSASANPHPVGRTLARRTRLALLASTALVAVAMASPAAANGGAGGNSNGTAGGRFTGGGAGGTTNTTTAGGGGGNSNNGSGGGGGGGGAGTTGGSGGFGNNGDSGGGGGGSAAVNGVGGSGGDGNTGQFGIGGGGGGGGAHGAVEASLPTIAVTGGNGGNGANGGFGGGGGGGAGGFGAVVTGTGYLGMLNVNATGGTGGNAGGGTLAGTGGDGGVGLFFSNAAGATFYVGTGVTVKGGAAGSGGSATNGAGISGQNLTIVMSVGASVIGGGGGAGNAITFTGGNNNLSFEGTTSGLTGAIANNGSTLIFHGSTNVTVSNVISGSGNVALSASGSTLTFSGANTYIGSTTIGDGTFNLTGSLANTSTSILLDGTLSGTGKSSGTVTSYSGTIAPGLSGAGNVGTLTMAGLALQDGSTLAFDLGTPNVIGGTANDLIQDNGALTLGGTLVVNQLTGFGPGTYRIVNYTGMLTNNGLAVSGAPTGSIVQAGAGQVNLLVAGANGVTQYWNGPTTAPGGTITGGTGTWTNSVGTTNWTDASGQFAESWAQGTAIFAGTAGTVTVNDSISFRALQFSTTGYTIAAGTGTLTATGAGSITTDQGVTASIAASIAGTVGLTKLGTGTLTLSAANGYTGGTTITGGTLQLGDGTNNGSVLGTITDDGALVLDPNGSQTVANTIMGSGSVSKIGTGTTILGGTNAYQGGTTLAGGTLSVASDGNLGATSGGLTFGGGTLETTADGFASARGITLSGAGTVQVDTAGNVSTLSGVLADGATSGALTKTGAGTLVLSAANTFSGGTTLTAGILQDDVATVGTPGAITSSGLGTGTVAFDGGTLQAGLDVTIANAATTDANGGTIDADGHTLTYSGTIKDAGGSTGTLTIASSTAGGTVVVTAANAYTGATTISSGTLQLGDGTASGSVAGTIVDDSALVLDPNGTSSVTTAISGTGTVRKIGAGTEVLSGTNSYQGGTTIAAGMLSVGADSNLGMTTGGLTFTGGTLETTADGFVSARAITLDTAGTVQVDTIGHTSTLSGTIGDGASAGSLTKSGAGTLVLSGTNSYSGGTTFAGGTLDVGSASAIGTMGTLSFTGGTLQYSAANTTDYSARFSMAANQAYSVDTNGQAVTFATALTSSGGSFAKLGAGTLTLTAANTYAGGTTISGGTLQIGANGTTGAITGNVLDNATLAFDRKDTITFAGSISGTGGIDQIGAGTTILTGTNGVTGTTSIDAGTLEVDGTLAAQNVTVNAGGTLAGTGTLSDPAIATGGTLRPGNAANPYGTLTVGPLSFAMGSFYAVAITPTANSMTKVTGTTTINGGTVQVSAGAGTYATRQYTILTSTMPVTGTFSGVTTNLAFLVPTLSYDTNDVFLNIVGNAVKGVDYRTAAATPNQYAVAAGLTNASFANGGTGAILGAFNQLTVPQAQAAFNAISGEGIAAAQNTAFGSTGLFISSIFDQTTFYSGDGGSANQITLTAPQPGFSAYAPTGDGGFTRTPIQNDHIRELADLPSTAAPIPAPIFAPQRTWRAWATGFGGVEDFSGNAFPVGSAGQSDTIYGGTLGIDYQLMPNYLAGLAIGGSNGDFSVPGRATSGSTTGGHVAFYDLATFGAFYAASTTSASFFSNQTTRTIVGFGGLGGETDRGNFRSNAYSSKVEFGRHFAAYGGLITPFASIELTDLRSYGFTETPLSGPGLFALNVQGQDTASVPSLVGARFQTVLPLGNGLVLSPSLQVAWEHQFSPQRPVLAGLINLPGAVFLTNGASPARDSAAVKAGGEVAISKQAALFANFDGDFSSVDRFYGGKGGFKYTW